MDLFRVMVIGLRGLVGEMIEAAIEAEPGLTLVAYERDADPACAIREVEPHVVIVESSDDGLSPAWLQVLASRPGLRVLAVDADHGTGIQYEMRPHAVRLGDVSPADIVAVIKGTGRRPWESPRD